MSAFFRARAPDYQVFDCVTMQTVPYMSEGSDSEEWRIAAIVQFFKKDVLLHTEEYESMRQAAQRLQDAMDDVRADPAQFAHFCDQEGCAEFAVNTYRMKRDVCPGCARVTEAIQFSKEKDTIFARKKHRRFCARHSYRGRNGRVDCHHNYVLVDGPGLS
jgi:hypothetical protein